MADSYKFLAHALTHLDSGLGELLIFAKAQPNKPTPYERIVTGLSESVYDHYRLRDTDEIGSTAADPSLVSKEFKKVEATLPSKNPQASPAERKIEAAMMSLVEYSALINRAKKEIKTALAAIRILDSRGRAVEKNIKAW